MNSQIMIAILICVILFVIYKYLQTKQIIKRKNQEIETSKILFNVILQHINAYILIIDRDFIVKKTNYYTQTETTDTGEKKKIGELIHCVNSLQEGCGHGELCKTCPIRQAITETFRSKKNFMNLETMVRLQLPESKFTRCNVAVSGSYMDLKDDYAQMLITIYDITELKQAQIRLQDTLQKTERAEKTKFTFLSQLGTEISDQLSRILEWANLINTNTHLTPQQQGEYIHLIHQQSEEVTLMTHEAFNHARIDSSKIHLQMSTFSLREFFQNILLLRANNTHPNVELYLDEESPDMLIYTDQKKLYHIIMHLLSNAQRFTDRGHIKVAYIPNKKKDIIHFTIEDTGIGIASNIHVHLFERFYKQNTFSDGPGLGLSICKVYIEAMGGNLQFTSSEGRGSRFHFSIKQETLPE